MRFASRTAAVAFLVVATVSCLEEDDRPCSGCTSPHPYTEHSGGTTGSLTGSAEATYEHGPLAYSCNAAGGCFWSGARIKIMATVPNAWVGADAGAEAEADAGAEADAEAEAEADANADAEADAGDDAEVDGDALVPDAATGSPRGWTTTAIVVLVDLGTTPLDEPSSPLVDARLITCPNRHEAIVASADGTFQCRSATVRPARIEPLEGHYGFTQSGNAEWSSLARTMNGKTPSGLRVSFTESSTTTPLRSYTVENCY